MTKSTAKIKNMQSQRIGALDGLRAIAIMLVLLWHLMPGRNSHQGLEGLVFKIADIGWSGVDLFFVLSGYLITSILWSYRQNNKSLYRFWVRRLLRIAPAYFLTVFLVFLVIPVVFDLYDIPSLYTQAPYWLYVSNFMLIFGPQPDLGQWFILGHFWSLAVEMQFYLIWPLIIWNMTPSTVIRVGLLLLLFALVGRILLVLTEVDWRVTFGWTPWRMDGLIVGSILATIVVLQVKITPKINYLLAACVILIGTVLFSVTWFGYASAIFKDPENLRFTVLRIILPLLLSLFFGLVLWFSLHDNLLSKILGAKLFKPIALYSYGIYIVHFLLLPTFENYLHPSILEAFVGSGDAAVYLYFLITSVISVLLAALSYHLFEVRFLRLKVKY